MEKVVKTFRSVAQVPSVSSARILKNHNGKKNSNQIVISSWWSQRCLERGKQVKFQQTFLVDASTYETYSYFPIDVSNELLSKLSPSEELRAVLREFSPQDNPTKKQQHLEIWKKMQLLSVSDLSALDVHGDVYTDNEFSSFEWSPCEKKVLYIAEKKIPKSEPFYKQKAQNDDSKKEEDSSGDGKNIKGNEYVYRQDWGELLVGRHESAVAVFDTQEGKIKIWEGIPSHLSPGQVTWAPGGSVVGVVWENEPRRLGLSFCTNRTSYIFHLTSDGQFRLLSGKGLAAKSPKFSPDKKQLLWLERPAGGPHHDAHRLVKYDWTNGKTETVVDYLTEKFDGVDPFQFRGLYCSKLPVHCWASDNVRVILNTPGPTSITICVINIETGEIRLLSKPKEEHSIRLLDIADDILICCKSDLRHPSTLIVGKLPPAGQEGEVLWHDITEWKIFPGLEDVKTSSYFTKATRLPTDNCEEINALYIVPASEGAQKVPVIVWPHGGPHASFANDFYISAALFSLLGFGIIMVNYRGSTGVGHKSVNYLLGKIGDTDVKDVHQVAEELCSSPLTNFDASRKVLYGGSHGGFLVTHLAGQYPESYKSVAAANPVTDVQAMITVTDIPDWCATESGQAYSFSGDISKEDFDKMYEASPIRYADKVVAPTLLNLGKKDLRVPFSQGLQYYHKLRAHNVKTKILLYEDTHSLSQVPHEIDSLINSVMWFAEHLDFKLE